MHEGGAPTFGKCTFLRNHADQTGSAIALEDESGVFFDQCTFTENTGDQGDSAVAWIVDADVTFRSSSFVDNPGGSGEVRGGLVLSGADALFDTCNLSREGEPGATAIESQSSTIVFDDLKIQGDSDDPAQLVFDGDALQSSGSFGWQLTHAHAALGACTLDSLSGAGVDLEVGSRVEVYPSAKFPTGVTMLAAPLAGAGEVTVQRGARLDLFAPGLIDLSESPPQQGCAPSGAAGSGVLFVDGIISNESGVIQNTNVALNNDISIGDCGNGAGGELWLGSTAVVQCNDITTNTDEYFIFDPSLSPRPVLLDNQVHAVVNEPTDSQEGELFELRTHDYDFAVGGGLSGAYQVPASAGYADPFALFELEILTDSKLNLTNRVGQVYEQPISGMPEALYVQTLRLHPGAQLNTALQRVYYQAIVDESGVPLDPNNLPGGRRVADVPLLGFSLNVIRMEDQCEFDVRVRTRLREPQDASYETGVVRRIAAPLSGDPNNHALEMRPRALFWPATSVAAHGAFARAQEARVTVVFRYQWRSGTDVNDPATELRVYLSDVDTPRVPGDPNDGDHHVLVARLRPPPAGRPGSVSSNEFATFYGKFARDQLDFLRGTYVELELRGANSNLWIDEWDPQIDCQACADLNGTATPDSLDFLVLLSEYGQALDPLDGDWNRPCLDAALSADKFVDLNDLLAWDMYLNGTDLNACGTGVATFYHADRPDKDGAATLTEDTWLLAGKRNDPNDPSGHEDWLLTLDPNLACLGAPQAPVAAPDPSAGQRSNGRLVRDRAREVYQLHATQGLYRLRDGQATIVPSVQTPNLAGLPPGSDVYVGTNIGGMGYFGWEFDGLPLLDVAFSHNQTNVAYVAPVVVDEPGDPDGVGRPYRAAAKLALNGDGTYSVLQVLGENPGDPNSGVAVSGDAWEVVYNPDYQRIREIEVDDGEVVYVLAAHALDSRWLLMYDGFSGARIGAAEELTTIDSPMEMTVSAAHPNRVYFTSAIFPRPNSSTEVYRFTINPFGFPPRVVHDDTITIDNSAAVLAYPSFPDSVANVTSLAEDPSTGDLLVLGFTGPFVPADLAIGDPSYLELFGAGAGRVHRGDCGAGAERQRRAGGVGAGELPRAGVADRRQLRSGPLRAGRHEL